MKAVKDRVIIELLPLTKKTVIGDIVIRNVKKGKVIAIGPLADNIKENDIVYFNKNSGEQIEYKDTLYHIISVTQVFFKEN